MGLCNIGEQQGGQGQPSPLLVWSMLEAFGELERISKKEISRKQNFYPQ